MASTVTAERKWILSGTPTPDTTEAAALSYIRNMLDFFGAGELTKHWQQLTSDFAAGPQSVGYRQVQSILSSIMIRCALSMFTAATINNYSQLRTQ
jgi:SNF2-related domain